MGCKLSRVLVFKPTPRVYTRNAIPYPPLIVVGRDKQCASGSINQIPPHATVSGDCRVTPFYSVKAVQQSIEAYVAEINADPSILPSRGPFSKYVLPAEDRKGTLELSWLTDGEDGIACSLASEGAKALNSATEKVRVKKSDPPGICTTLKCGTISTRDVRIRFDACTVVGCAATCVRNNCP